MKEGLIQNAQTTQAVKSGKPLTMQDYIKKMEGEIAKALPSVITPERFTRITLSALSANKQLAQTTPQSFLGAMMTAAQLGMEPNTPLGQAYLIPYKITARWSASSSLAIKVSLIWRTAAARSTSFRRRWSTRTTSSNIPSVWNRSSPTAPRAASAESRASSTPCSARRTAAWATM